MTRLIGKQRWHFLFNASQQAYCGKATVHTGAWLADGAGPAKRLPRATSGRPLVTLPPFGSRLLKEVSPAAKDPTPTEWARRALEGWSVRPAGDNVLVLTDWSVGPGERRIRKRLQLPLDYDLPALIGNRQEAWYATSFVTTGKLARAKLVWDESSILGTYHIRVNDKALPNGERERIYDSHNLAADITPLLLPKGRNQIRIHVQGPTPKLIEPLRIYGEFEAKPGRPGRSPSRLAPAALPIYTRQCKRWAELGWPHYSGVMVYETTCPLPDPAPKRAKLVFERVATVAKVSVNGEECDIVAWAPWECDLTGAMGPGTNDLRVEVANTSINAIEGQPSESGILGGVHLLTT